jgi:Calx-beta domain
MSTQAISWMRRRAGRYAGMVAGFSDWCSRSRVLTVAAGMVLAVGLFASPAAAVASSITLKPSAGALTSTVTPNIAAPPDVIVGEADGHVNLPVTLSAASTQTVTVNYATANSTALSSTGCNYAYTGVNGTLTFSPGQTTKVVSVTLLNCGLSGFLSFTFNLSGATNATIVRPSTRIGIVGDPKAGSTAPGLYARSAYVDNRAGSVNVPVLLGGPAGATSNSTVTVHYATKNNSALAGTDYKAVSGTLTFGPGQTVQNITVPILDRASAAPTRNFTVILSSPVNATLVQNTATITIGASGATAVASPNISAPPDGIVSEADGYLDLPVTLSAPATKSVTVNYATANSTALSSTGCNYAYVGVPNPGSTAGTLTFTPGQTIQTVRVDLLNCGLSGFLSFTFNLSGATNATIVRPSTRIGIVGDPKAGSTAPGLYARSAYVDNRAGSVNVPVLLGGPAGATSNSTVTVHYATKNNSALAGTDYKAVSGTLTFGPGQTVQNITVPILDRASAAPTRNFTVILSSPVNATLVQNTATITIGASGATSVSTPKISAPPNTTVGEATGYVDLPVTLNAPGQNTVTVNYATANGTALSGTGCNYAYVGVPNPGSTAGTLTFTPGQTIQTVRVDLLNCNLANPGTFTFNLSAATNGTIVRATATITIVQNLATISSFSPTSGPVGTTVTINGQGLARPAQRP